MKYLKIYESISETEQKCQEYNIKNYRINSNGTVDVDGYVDLSLKKLNEIPIHFNIVYGDFTCYENKLTTLKNSPIRCDGKFECENNQLKSLKYSPEYVGNRFDCSSNRLTSLIGGPKIVSGDYNFSKNNIVNFNGFPQNYNFNNYIYTFDNPISEVTSLSILANTGTKNIMDKSSLIKYLIEFDVIRGNTIIEQRLDAAFRVAFDIELDIRHKEFKNYTLI